MKNYESVSDDDIRAIHSRLDVQNQAILKLALSCTLHGGMDHSCRDEIIDMLEESQNPFSEAKE